MSDLNLKISGKEDNFWSEKELIYINNYLSRLPNFTKTKYNTISVGGITSDHPLYNWFIKNVFSKIQKVFGKNLRFTFGEFLFETSPVTLHSDYFFKSQYKNKNEPYMTFLIPIAVNNDYKQVEKTNTIIFNEIDTVDDNIDGDWPDYSWKSDRTIKKNNVLETCYDLVSHIEREDLECLTLREILNWKEGSLLYWDSKLLHCSDNFLLKDVKSKSAIVIHTHVV